MTNVLGIPACVTDGVQEYLLRFHANCPLAVIVVMRGSGVDSLRLNQ